MLLPLSLPLARSLCVCASVCACVRVCLSLAVLTHHTELTTCSCASSQLHIFLPLPFLAEIDQIETQWSVPPSASRESAPFSALLKAIDETALACASSRCAGLRVTGRFWLPTLAPARLQMMTLKSWAAEAR